MTYDTINILFLEWAAPWLGAAAAGMFLALAISKINHKIKEYRKRKEIEKYIASLPSYRQRSARIKLLTK